MENATQQEVQDALELEQVVEENVVDDLNKAQINPLSAREKALEEIYNRRREEEHVENVLEEEAREAPDAPVWFNGEQWVTKVKVNGEEVDVPFDSLKSSHHRS
jgi:hypothetical protein